MRRASSGIFSLVAATLLFTATGCDRAPGGKQSPDSTLKDLVADRGGKNIALVFGAANGLPGVATDLSELSKMLKDPAYDFGFEVRVIEDATKSTIMSETQKASLDVGERGTLFWYFSGHGAQDGTIYTADQDFLGWREIAVGIKSARSTPVARLIVLEDSCFSGNIVDGSQVINNSAYSAKTADAQAGRAAGNIMSALNSVNSAQKSAGGSYASSSLYQQALIFSASRSSETSEDAGSEMGGAFTYSFRTVLGQLKTSKPDATIKDFVTQAQTATSSQFSHTPQFRADPEAAVMGDALFKRGGGSVLPNGGGDGSLRHDMALALAGESQADSFQTMIGIGAASDVAKVGICRGDRATCEAAKKIDVAFGGGVAKADRMIFRSLDAMALSAGQNVTLLGFRADGSLSDSLQVSFKSN